MTPTPKEIQDLRLSHFMTHSEVAAKTNLSVRQVKNAENPSSKDSAKKRREEIRAAILQHGTGLPHEGRTIRWKVMGKVFNGVVIRSPYRPQQATITRCVLVYCLEGGDNRIVHHDKITEVIR